MFTRRFLQRAPRAVVSQPRFLSTTAPRFASKDTQDKDSLKPRSNEYSKSGSDDAAAHSDAAFDPNKTSPEAAEQTAEAEGKGEGGESDALNVSPGNPEVSKPRGAQEGGASEGVRTKTSGGGSAPKSGGSKSG
ncbi:uncharacterized protein N0V89_008114 [Didymosphaeria variabile]|uniref:Uncharacterized protein n=1 Tax=Didymosphaeria variabile TaxID=1932322 RepID=A0A9W8XFT4_9PLEO|nr:uncharacterized protein N0V89_008114 [Didymosphaeria variabile]KAJ4349498.1 hypothetical protein N0V89_008114 [Didymosphaeria variabile]